MAGHFEIVTSKEGHVRHVFVSLLIILGLTAGVARAAGSTPAGYIVEILLIGEDKDRGTAVVRNKADLQPKLMMPLFAGDAVYVKDAKSHILIETGGGETITVGASSMRVEISGEIDTGGGTWNILAAIGGIFAGDDGQAPENMVAKGGGLKMPMARRNGNLLLAGRRKLWLGWLGGTAPFTVALMDQGVETQLASGITATATDLVLPEKMPDRFGLVLRDAAQQQVRLRFRFAGRLPRFEEELLPSVTSRLAQAAFLTGQADGAWTVEAAQVLREGGGPAADALLAHVQSGWKLK